MPSSDGEQTRIDGEVTNRRVGHEVPRARATPDQGISFERLAEGGAFPRGQDRRHDLEAL